MTSSSTNQPSAPRHTRWSTLAAAVVGAALLTACSTPVTDAAAPTATKPATAERVYVSHVADGDTITIRRSDQRQAKVRLIGVDTPETKKPYTAVQCYGPQATAFTTTTVRHQWVWIEHDPTVDTTDRYGRELAYVWIDDHRLLNQELIAGGYGRQYAYNDQHYHYRPAFENAETAARDNHRGLWRTCADQ